ncbi:MAG: MinD/ParA family protein [Candidatus Latescibacteria bacterium]|nr:MinD/ParA family protein [Candidatus Latescibacterota bacterium]
MEKSHHRAVVLAVTSGKGGVGKTSIALNLSVVLSQLGAHVLLIDASMGLANVDVMLGLAPRGTLDQVVSRKQTLLDIICEGPAGLSVIPSSSGIGSPDRWATGDITFLKREFRRLERGFDYIIIDTASGISPKVTDFVFTADDALVIVTPEPTSIVDAYSMIKVIVKAREIPRQIPIIANMVTSGHEADALTRKLDRIVHRFLGQGVVMTGYLPTDATVGQAVYAQVPFVLGAPQSVAAQCIERIARRLLISYPRMRVNAQSEMLSLAQHPGKDEPHA